MKPELAELVMRGPADPLLVKEVLRLEALVKVLQEEMRWRSGQPIDKGYYLCAIVDHTQPSELYWDGSSWTYLVEYEEREIVDNNHVLYYMRLGDISMPEGW